MYQVFIKPFLDMQDMLVQWDHIARTSNAAYQQMLNAGNKTYYAGYLRKLIAEIHAPEFDMCRRSAQRFLDHLENGTPGEQLLADAHELRGRLLDQLDGIRFLGLSSSEAKLFQADSPPFGQEVDDVFPIASEDISESAKCLALGRTTAAVFHLMRAMECAVQVLSQELGIKNVEREWGKLLSDIANAIEKMTKGRERDRWSEVHTHLYHVKEAWRNHTMHPKQTYTEDEAAAILSAVRVFMDALAKLVRR